MRTTTYNPQNSTPQNDRTERFFGWIVSLFMTLREQPDGRRATEQLEALDDRMLADIGPHARGGG